MIVALLALSAIAQDAVSFTGVSTLCPCDNERPHMIFHANEPGHIDAEMDCGRHHFSVSRSVSSGTDVKLDLRIPPGEFRCTGKLVMALANGATIEQGLKMDIACLPLLTWEHSSDDVDVKANTLVVHPSRPLTVAIMEIYTVGGALALTADADLSDPLHPTFSWSGDVEEVKIVVQGQDKHGFPGSLDLQPWYYSIPHEDVVFASGSHAIEAAQRPKLDKTWRETIDVMNKYGAIIDIKLYVAGYTDTVGAAGSNQALSERRARAIAQWFRSAGFREDIYYQGFGEKGQAVKTGDEVDEGRNRRALYVLAAERPPPSPDLPGANWKRL